MLTIWIVPKVKPQVGPDPVQQAEQAIDSQKGGRIWPMVLLIVVVLGGLYSGVATPTENSAIGATGALLLTLHARRMSRHNYVEAVGASLGITPMIMMIIIGAHVVCDFISFTKITDTLLTWITQSGIDPGQVILIVVGIYLLLGMFMDQAAILIMTDPISNALTVGLGYDRVWWSVIINKTSEVDLVSPPLGLVTFVTASATRRALKTSFARILIFLTGERVTLGLLLAFPQLTLWLT